MWLYLLYIRCKSEEEKIKFPGNFGDFWVQLTLGIIKMIFPPFLLMRLNHEMSVTDNTLGSIIEMWEERAGFCSRNIYTTIEYI